MSTSRRDIVQMLQCYSRKAVETWAEARGIEFAKVALPKLQQDVASKLLESRAVKAEFEKTSPEERHALARLKMWETPTPVAELRGQLVADGLEDPDAAIRSLMTRGLLFYDRTYQYYHFGRQWELWQPNKEELTPPFWLPPEIRDLVTVSPDLGHLPFEPPAEPPDEIREPPYATLQRDIYLLLQTLRENPIKLLKSGDVGKRESERLLKILPKTGAAGDPTTEARKSGDWFQFLWYLLQLSGLIQERDSTLLPSAIGLQFLQAAESEQVARMLEGWQRQTGWNELLRVPTLAFETRMFVEMPTPEALTNARATVLRLFMREKPYPGWYSVDSLLASIKRHRVSILIPRAVSNAYAWQRTPAEEAALYRGIYAKGSSPKQFFNKERDWDQVEGGFFRAVLEESLLWIGAVRLGYRDGRLVGFSLSERGASALSIIPPMAPPDAVTSKAATTGGRALVVQPNFEVVVYPDIAGVGLLVELDRFAERVRLDQAAVYRLTRETVCRGLQSNYTLARIQKLLETHNGGPLPQNVTYSLQEWSQLFERIHVRRSVTLIEASDDDELRILRQMPELANAREVAPRVLLIPAGAKPPRLRRPTQTFDYQQPILDALEFESATRFRILPGAASPRLVHRVEQIADRADEAQAKGRKSKGAVEREKKAVYEEGGVYTLSREKIARVAKWWKWDEVYAFLGGTAKKKPGPETGVILKGWAGALAAPALSPITVLAAPSGAWMDEVILVPAVKALIAQRLTPSMALVRGEDREKLEQALADLGVTPTAGEKLGDLLAAAGKADTDSEVFLVGPPKKRRAMIEQAIANKQMIVIGTVDYGSNRLHKTILEPLRITGDGAGAALVAKMPGHRYEYEFNLNRIQAVRVHDPPPAKK